MPNFVNDNQLLNNRQGSAGGGLEGLNLFIVTKI